MNAADGYRVTLAPADASLQSRLDSDPLLAGRFVPRGSDSGSGLGAEAALSAVLTVHALKALVQLARVWASDRRSQVRMRVSSGGMQVTISVNGRSDPSMLLQQILDQLERPPSPPAREVRPAAAGDSAAVDPPVGTIVRHDHEPTHDAVGDSTPPPALSG